MSLIVASCRSVDCYDTCVHSLVDATPLQVCADWIHVPNVMSVKGPDAESNVIIEIFPPALGSNYYQSNRFCKCVHANELYHHACTSSTALHYACMHTSNTGTMFNAQIIPTCFTSQWCESILNHLMQVTNV